MGTSTPSIPPAYTLNEAAQLQMGGLWDENILVFDMDARDLAAVRLNYPVKGGFLGLMVLMTGTAVIKADFELAELKSRDVVRVLPNNILEFQSLSTDCRITCLLISLDYASSLRFRKDSNGAMAFLSNTYSKFLSLDEKTFSILQYHLSKLQEINRKDSGHHFPDDVMRFNLSLIFYELANFAKGCFEHPMGNVVTSPRREDLAIQFISTVVGHYHQQRSVAFYARQLHVSRKHLTKIIKAVYGLTPKQIIDAKVIAEAKVLLQQHEFNVRQVMDKLGFEDQAVFSKFFKKHTGVPPLSYRRQIVN